MLFASCTAFKFFKKALNMSESNVDLITFIILYISLLVIKWALIPAALFVLFTFLVGSTVSFSILGGVLAFGIFGYLIKNI